MIYRTPDVYVEEISVFPPSVAEVETAIPAFIGYTKRASRTVDNDLRNVPTKVTSLLEYESLFGSSPSLTINKVVMDGSYNFTRAEIANSKYLYDSLRLFFDNGGGKCYIVSVGADSETLDADKLMAGIDKIAAVDEPTILLFPDAAELDADKLAQVQQKALAQCGKLGDRVALLDTKYYNNKHDHDNRIAELRGKLGVNSLKYGAAYAPWLKLAYSKKVAYADIKGKLYQGAVLSSLSSLTGDAQLKDQISLIDKALADQNSIKTAIATLVGSAGNLLSKQEELMRDFVTNKTVVEMQNLFALLMSTARMFDGFATGGSALTHTFTPLPPAPPLAQGILPSVKAMIAGPLKTAIGSMISLEKELENEATTSYDARWDEGTAPSATEWGTVFSASPAASIGNISGADPAAILSSALPGFHAAFNALQTALNNLVTEAARWANLHEQFLYENFPIYRNLIKGVASSITVCPPSGAIAGIYALTDNTRGVWKAPANVSLTGVIEPCYYFDSDDTDNLNVDAVAGKSVNAIRAFAGKGTLVWGARTLAGNDNEWRYISVRRFFNMVEESVKKSTYWAVFEPNTANTWVKVRGMIENYLTQKWREGALAGATPKDAFFVRCGLGITMNAQDILEGRMNVEVGMAVARPAEFIVLKFSHKLQTS